ncbi:hypothetical protein ACU4GH_29000 [Bradyrhizobium betae]
MLHGFKAPHDAIVLADGTVLVAELGTKSLVKVSGEHGKDRTTLIGDLEGPVGLVRRQDRRGLRHRGLCGHRVPDRQQR